MTAGKKSRNVLWFWTALAALLVLGTVATWFLIGQGRDRANQWLGIVAGYIAVFSAAGAMLRWLWTRRATNHPKPRYSAAIYAVAMVFALAGGAYSIAATLLHGAGSGTGDVAMDGTFGYTKDPRFIEYLRNKRHVRFNSVENGSRHVANSIDPKRFDMAGLGSEIYEPTLTRNLGQADSRQGVVSATPYWSTLVIATTLPVAEALRDKGVTRFDDKEKVWRFSPDGYLAARQRQLRWSDLAIDGYNTDYQVTVAITDEEQSNSAEMFIGILSTRANRMDGGPRPVTSTAQASRVLPQFRGCVEDVGQKSESTARLAEKWAASPTSFPLTLMYENDFLAIALGKDTSERARNEQWVALYVDPTVMVKHVIKAWTSSGKKVIDALSDQPIRDLIFEFGYRDNNTGTGDGKGSFKHRMRERGIDVPATAGQSSGVIPEGPILDYFIEQLTPHTSQSQIPVPATGR